jgi:hypothetical protein
MERRLFTVEFKRESVRLTRQPGISKAEISRDWGINASCSINQVARLMQASGIKARHMRRRLPGQLVSADRAFGSACWIVRTRFKIVTSKLQLLTEATA